MKYARSATLAALPVLLLCGSASLPAAAPPAPCPTPDEKGVLKFGNDHDALARLVPDLHVNGDGATGAYTPDDTGYIYIANGVDLIEGGRNIECRTLPISACGDAFQTARKGDFGPGTPELCAFGFAVDPYAPGRATVPCTGKEDARVIGNGKGRPRIALQTEARLVGSRTPVYESLTAVQQRVDGKIRQLDALTVPALVAPKGRADLLGALVWVRYGNVEKFAVIGDTGPSFEEGSIALHQLLRYPSLPTPQLIGPIPPDLRCDLPDRPGLEASVHAPFLPAPDIKTDTCADTGGHPKTKADIRAKSGLYNVQIIVFPDIRVPMVSARLIDGELTPARLAEIGSRIPRARIDAIRTCL